MMNRKEFYEYVKDNVKDYLPDSYQNGEIRIEEVAKNNGLRLTGISIPQGDQRRRFFVSLSLPDAVSVSGNLLFLVSFGTFSEFCKILLSFL